MADVSIGGMDVHRFIQKVDSVMANYPKDLDVYMTKMNTLLMYLSEAEDPPLIGKRWMKEARELYYCMEDYFDHVSARANVSSSWRQKIKLRGKSQISNKVREFRDRLKQACERYESYNLYSLPRRVSSYGPKLPIRQAEVIDNGTMDSLLKKLDTGGEKQLKVISIYGPGGVGKTTLSRRLYEKIRGDFECRAFVWVSWYPDMQRLLTAIFYQIHKKQPRQDWDSNDIINDIAKHLQSKRYLIIIDDLWDQSIWDIVINAFPEGCYGSRVISTTRFENIASACCSYDSKYTYEMRPLTGKHSRELFFNMVFDCEDNCPEELKKKSYEIIRECGGLPLSTVNMASLLSSEPTLLLENWEHIKRYLSTSSMADPSKLVVQQNGLSPRDPTSSEEIKKVLNLLYNNLPPHLKACLLYLNMYPADYTIKKDDLVKQWMAEGFLSMHQGQDTDQEAAGCYFDDLLSRGMIQPLDKYSNGQVYSCTINHAVLDFIAYKSMEENFITIVDSFQSNNLQSSDTARRLSVQFGGAKSANIPVGITVSRVRSLMFFGFVKCLPSIMEYKLLRVLVLHVWADQDKMSFDVTRISQLFLLRYLKVECNITVKLPERIKGLRFLETLYVDARVCDVPLDIFQLQSLLHLRLPDVTARLAHQFGQMNYLRIHTLGYFDLSINSRIRNLIELIDLRDLQLTCSLLPSECFYWNMVNLGFVLLSLSNLRSVAIVPFPYGGNTVEAGGSSVTIPCDGSKSIPSSSVLERLELYPRICIFNTLPRWIGEHDKLRIIKIAVMKVLQKDIDTLKSFNALSALSLYVRTAPEERIVFQNDGFPVLKKFKFISSALRLVFREGAMPNVQTLKLGMSANTIIEQNSPAVEGLENLKSLAVFSAKIGCSGAPDSVRQAVRSTLEAVFSSCGRRPIINVQWVDEIFYDQMSTVLETKQPKADPRIVHVTGGTNNEKSETGGKSSPTGTEETLKTTSVEKIGPWGWGSQLDNMCDIDVAPPLQLESITVNHGDVVDGLSFSYKDYKMQPHTTGPWGGSGGQKTTIQLGPLEFVTEVHGEYGPYYGHDAIAKLTFVTNRRRHGPFGDVQDKSGWGHFSFGVKDNRSIVGFFANTGHKYLSAIGVYVKPL